MSTPAKTQRGQCSIQMGEGKIDRGDRRRGIKENLRDPKGRLIAKITKQKKVIIIFVKIAFL